MREKFIDLAANVIVSAVAWGALEFTAHRIGFDTTVLLALGCVLANVTPQEPK